LEIGKGQGSQGMKSQDKQHLPKSKVEEEVNAKSKGKIITTVHIEEDKKKIRHVPGWRGNWAHYGGVSWFHE